ncbi:hypothetical protein D3C71_1215140 [compost metagenome]
MVLSTSCVSASSPNSFFVASIRFTWFVMPLSFSSCVNMLSKPANWPFLSKNCRLMPSPASSLFAFASLPASIDSCATFRMALPAGSPFMPA